VDPRVVIKEERADITEDVICNNSTTSSKAMTTTPFKASAATEGTEAKVVVIKEAKVAITNETLATLSAKLSVNNHTFHTNTNSIPVPFTIIYSKYKSHSYILFYTQNSFIPSSHPV